MEGKRIGPVGEGEVEGGGWKMGFRGKAKGEGQRVRLRVK